MKNFIYCISLILALVFVSGCGSGPYVRMTMQDGDGMTVVKVEGKEERSIDSDTASKEGYFHVNWDPSSLMIISTPSIRKDFKLYFKSGMFLVDKNGNITPVHENVLENFGEKGAFYQLRADLVGFDKNPVEVPFEKIADYTVQKGVVIMIAASQTRVVTFIGIPVIGIPAGTKLTAYYIPFKEVRKLGNYWAAIPDPSGIKSKDVTSADRTMKDLYEFLVQN